MPLTDQRHTVRLPLPDMIVRDRAHTVAAPVYVDGTTAVTPASWSVAVYDPSNTSVETGTGSSSAASHTIGSGDLSSYALGDGWRVEWVITLSDGTVLTQRNDAMLVRCGLWPVVGDVDKLARAVVDGLVQGGALADDRHVTALTVGKRFAEPGESPGVACTVASVRIAA
jgi:hypothetical protein